MYCEVEAQQLCYFTVTLNRQWTRRNTQNMIEAGKEKMMSHVYVL
jgi:hypothetical protein